VFSYIHCLQFQSSWKEISVLQRKPFPVLVTVLSVQINQEHRNSAGDSLSITPPRCQLRSLTACMAAQFIFSNATVVSVLQRQFSVIYQRLCLKFLWHYLLFYVASILIFFLFCESAMLMLLTSRNEKYDNAVASNDMTSYNVRQYRPTFSKLELGI
jgi:hypothetical protein